MSTSFLPPLSVLHNSRWEKAPTRTSSTAPNAARIFDSLALNNSGQRPSPSLIPLHPDQPHYSHKRYWRLPGTALGGILSAVVLRAIVSPSSADDELEMVRFLHGLLVVRKSGLDAGLSGEGRREDEGGRGRRGGGRGGGRGGKGRRRTPQKRAAEEDDDTRHDTRSSNKRRHVHSSAAIAARGESDFNKEMDCGSFYSYGSDCSQQNNPAKWVFGPEQSTNTIVYRTAGTMLDPEYFHAWARR